MQLVDISASKWAIVSEDERLFNVTEDVGGISIPHGVLYAALEKTGTDGIDKIYHIFNTHFAVSAFFPYKIIDHYLLHQ